MISYYLLTLFIILVQGPQKVKYGKDNIITAKDIIIATGSVPFVPKGIEVDGMCFMPGKEPLCYYSNQLKVAYVFVL